MNVITKYNKALQDLYKHVGFVEDWVVCPIDDQTDCFWSVDLDKNGGGSVKFAETMDKFNSDGDYYLDDIYTQRFYDKWIYRGEKYTMIFCDPHVDGMKWFRVFDNSKCQNKDEVRDRKIKQIIEK